MVNHWLLVLLCDPRLFVGADRLFVLFCIRSHMIATLGNVYALTVIYPRIHIIT